MNKFRKCGQKFVERSQSMEIKKAKVWQQDNNIDVLARIGEYVLLIDKTGTRVVIQRYYVLEKKTQAKDVDNGNILPIYLKTGNQSLFDRMRIEYSTFERFIQPHIMTVVIFSK